MPKPNMNPALPPGMGGMGPAGAGFGAASGAAAPAAKPTTPKIVIQYSSGQLFVHSVQQQMLKVYDLGPDGMPKNLEVYKVKLANMYCRACGRSCMLAGACTFLRASSAGALAGC